MVTLFRLMQDDELPEWMLADLSALDEDITDNYGRGMRERKEVKYDDRLSDLQFAKMLEGEDIGNSSESESEIRKRKRAAGIIEDDENPKKKVGNFAEISSEFLYRTRHLLFKMRLIRFGMRLPRKRMRLVDS
jgi:hypothetical protein